MAVASSEPHTIIQSWVSVSVAQELKAQAKATGCSLSSLVRDAIEDQLRHDGEGMARGGRNQEPLRATSPAAADHKEV